LRERTTDMMTTVLTEPDAPFAEVLPSRQEKNMTLVRAASVEPGQGLMSMLDAMEDDEDDRVPVSEPEYSEEPFLKTDAERDAEARAARPPAPAKGVKRPMRAPSPEFDAVPDLAEIFDNYDTPLATRVSICRAYASYVASTLPKKPKVIKKKK